GAGLELAPQIGIEPLISGLFNLRDLRVVDLDEIDREQQSLVDLRVTTEAQRCGAGAPRQDRQQGGRTACGETRPSLPQGFLLSHSWLYCSSTRRLTVWRI